MSDLSQKRKKTVMTLDMLVKLTLGVNFINI